MRRVGKRVLWGIGRPACIVLVGCLPVLAQAIPQSPTSRRQNDSEARIAALDQSLRETRAELAETRAEIKQLRSLLEQLMNQKAAVVPSAPKASSQLPKTPEKRAAASPRSNAPGSQQLARISEDDWQILNAKVEEQAQDKVESGSKYRLKLWGLALFNAFGVSGHVDDLDVPTFALPRASGSSSGSLGGSLRQSILGITGTGPDILGARTSADLQMDFFGGLPSGYGGGSSGILRLRLSRIRFDWEHTSVVGGLDTPFFSPNVPTTFMSVAVPAFASAGNLWTWSPTIRVEHRFDTSVSQFKVEAGFLAPSGYAAASSDIRRPTPGESSRQPVYAVRFSANGTKGDRPASLGISGLYFPQRFTGGTRVSGWGGILDWRFPLIPHTELSGEFFAGKGLDSFGGVPVPNIQQQDYTDYVLVGASELAQIPMLGGWSQLKVVLDSRHEFNVAFGTGGRKASSLAQAALLAPSLDYLSPRNQMMFVNYIFRPRSNLLFSTEYRRLRTYFPYRSPATADQFGIAAGFLF